ncbi:MAG: tetratricopeptide repeat protein, partial [candidate division Zixibacteria bacterium]|nr:tetratricopeptide repeat protein [candidate division Zixibacteria bacterium]
GETTANVDILAFHFYRARSWEKGFSYSLEAAQQSYRAYSLTECSRYFRQCLDILEGSGENDLEIEKKLRFYKSYTDFLVLEGRYSEAYGMFRAWRRLGKTSGQVHESLLAATEAARLLWQQSRYSTSRYFLERVLAFRHTPGEEKVAAKAYTIMAELDRRAGKFKQAQQWCTKAIDIAACNNDHQALADAHNKLGLALWGEGRLAEAAASYEKSLELSEDYDSMYAQAKTSNNLAIVQWERGDFLVAEELMTRALAVFRDIGDRRNETYASGNLANLYRIFGKLVEAEKLFRRADLIFTRLGDRHAHYYTVGNIGDIDLIRGDLQSAEGKYRQVSEFAESVDDKELTSECGVRFGELAFFRNEIDEAESWYNRAMKMAKAIGSAEYYIRGCIGLARLQIGRRNREKAMLLINTILNEAEKNNAIIAQNEGIFLKGEFFRISGQAEEAEKCYRRVLKYAQQQRVFELILKSAMRLYELDSSSRQSSTTILQRLAREFAEKNGQKSFNEILDSAYFSHFNPTMQEIFSGNQLVFANRP